MAKSDFYKIREHKHLNEKGEESLYYTVRWEKTVQQFKTREDAQKFVDSHGTVDKSVRLEKTDEKSKD